MLMKIFTLSNAFASISFEEKSVKSLLIKGEEMVYGDIPFFAIKIRNKDASSYILTAYDFQYDHEKNDVVKYIHHEFDVYLTIKSNNEDSLIWKIKVINKSDKLIEQVELMSMGLLDKLKDEEGGKGEIIIPYNEGALVTNLERRLNSPFGYMEPDYPSRGIYFMYPNMICSQFEGYIANNKGIYFGMHDNKHTPKHIDFKKENNCLKIQMRTFTNVSFGDDYESDFDSVLKIFEGDYYDCFEIYRNWFEKNKNPNIKKIKDNKDLPEWYHESPLVITYPVRGLKDSDKAMLENPNLYPYSNVIPFLKEVGEKTNSKVMTLLMHWEGTAPWAPPYSWPPYGGEGLFSSFLNECHKENILVGLYTSGLGWTQTSYRAVYDRQKEFERDNLANIMCKNTDGYMFSTVVSDIRLGYDLCPMLDKTKQLIRQETEKLLNSGVDYVQILDQNHGGCSYFCYALDHGHVPAPGSWQVDETLKLLESIEKDKALLGCESGASEPFLSQLLFSDNRFILNYYIGTPIPLYAYIYHEYVNNFMGNQICMALDYQDNSFTYRLAYSFLAGDMFTLVINNNYDIMDAWCLDRTVDKDVVLTFINTLTKWRIDQSEYLHLGRMEKPESYQTTNEYFIHEDRTKLEYKSILSTSFSNNGKTMQLFVNYNLKPVLLGFSEEKTIYLDSKLSKSISAKEIEIPPLEVVAIIKE